MRIMKERHLITYPGFAEGKDAKGLYTDLEGLHDCKNGGNYNVHILPFYEQNTDGDRVVRSIGEHVSILQAYMDSLDGEITVIGKCGGSRVVVSMDEEHIARTERIALINIPPWKGNRLGVEKMIHGWGGGPVGDGGTWYIPRDATGSKRYVVENDYLDEVDGFDTLDKCRSIARNPSAELYIVRGMKDEVVRVVDTGEIPGAKFIDIENGDHHLTGASRQIALRALVNRGVLER